MPITNKELRKWLKNNSIIGKNDNIVSITVEEGKHLVRVTGNAEEKGITKPIQFSATFDEVKGEPAKFKQKPDREPIRLLDDEIEEEEVKDEDKVRDPEPEGTEKAGEEKPAEEKDKTV